MPPLWILTVLGLALVTNLLGGIAIACLAYIGRRITGTT